MHNNNIGINVLLLLQFIIIIIIIIMLYTIQQTNFVVIY